IRARRSLALVAARLQADVQRRPDWIGGAGLERRDLRMRTAVGRVVALTEHVPVTDHDRPDERIRTREAASLLRQLDRPLYVLLILVAHCSCAPNRRVRLSRTPGPGIRKLLAGRSLRRFYSAALRGAARASFPNTFFQA